MIDWISVTDKTRAWAEGPVGVWGPQKVFCFRDEFGDFMFADGEKIEGVTHFFYLHPPHAVIGNDP